MKLIIQIPCYNEEKTLPYTINDLPKAIKGIDIIEYLVIDDDSTDNTVKVAESLGVHHIVKVPSNRGLANAFMVGINECLKQGADIIVNTDGDNQYYGLDVVKIIDPILYTNAEIVIGDRQTDTVEDFSKRKKILQKIGSFIVRIISKSNVVDATCGFRAYSKEAALRINVISDYTYTLETIIDAGIRKTKIVNIKIKTNDRLRKSRLFNSSWDYVKKSIFTITRIYIMNKPNRALLIPAIINILIGLIIIMFLRSNTNFLILSLFFIVVGIQFIMTYIIVDSLFASRKTNNQVLYLLKKETYNKTK